MIRVGHARVFAGLVVALVILHLDAWNAGRAEPLVLGFLPWDMAYHLGWMIAAMAVIFYMTVWVWPEEE